MHGTCEPKFPVNVFVHVSLFESISDESTSIGPDRNFVFFSNMGLEILCLFLFNSDGLFERPEKLFVVVNEQVFVYPISPFLTMLKIIGVDHFVERTLL